MNVTPSRGKIAGMNTKIQVQARGPQKAEILIYDAIGQDILGDGTTAATFDRELTALGDVQHITVRINSPGGAVWDGIAIYNRLKQHPARVRVVIDGLAASIASLIAMAGDRIEIGDSAMVMIHDPHTLAIGDADDMRQVADMLDKVGASMVEAYTARTGLSKQRVIALMDAETWFTADEAIAHRFADARVAQPDKARAPAAMARWASVLAHYQYTPESLKENNAMTTEASEARADQVKNLFAGLRSIKSLNSRAELLDNLETRALLDPKLTEDQIRAEILAELGRGQEGMRLPTADHVVRPGGSGYDFRDAAVDALLIRAGISVPDKHPGAHDVLGMSLHEIARASLSHSGRREGYLSGSKLVRAAMTTSDFPAILENALGKAIRRGYETEPASHRSWVRVQTVADFRDQPRPILGSAPDLQKVIEGGEYQHGSMDDDRAVYKVEKFGRIVALTWEALVNDDLGAFLRVQPALGQAARRLEADLVYGLLAENGGDGQTMQDTNPLFHATHNNAVEAGPLGVGTLGAARALLRKQTAIGGGLLNLVPRFLIVGADRETEAEMLLAAATRYVSQSTEAMTPRWLSSLEMVVEPRLAADVAYVAASSDQIDTVELGTLDADGNGPTVEEESEFDRDVRRWKVRHVVGARFLDWRGIVKIPVVDPDPEAPIG